MSAYPRGTVELAELPLYKSRLSPYQYRRLEGLRRRGVAEAVIDQHGNAYARTRTGYVVKVRRPGRRWPRAYYGISLGAWIDVVRMSGHVHAAGWIGIVAVQILVHEAWPRVFRRRGPSAADRAVRRFGGVL